MKKISKAELKSALIKAAAQRANQLSGLQPSNAERAQLQKSRRASAKLSFLTQAGLDLTKLQVATGQQSALQQRLVQKEKDAALRFAAKNKSGRQAGIQKQRDAWLALAEPTKSTGRLRSRHGYLISPHVGRCLPLDLPFYRILPM